MATTTYDYDYDDCSDYPATLVSPCNRDVDNYVGAQLSILYYFMFLLSLFGNALVLTIIYRFERVTTVTNILLVNLVMSSLIFMSSLPFLGVYMQLSNWIFGKVMCKIVGSVYYLGFYSSALFLTLLTFDRHVAVVYSLSTSRMRNQSYAIVSCLVVWLISSLACIKPMILHTTFFNYINNNTYCQEYPGDLPYIDVSQVRISGFYLQLLLFFLFPLAVIVYSYIRIAITVISSKLVTKFKTVRLVFIIVLLFFVCWTPFNIVLLIHDESSNCEQAQKRSFALHVTRNFTYIYFCISPIFYTFVGKKFQTYFRQLVMKQFPQFKRHFQRSQCSRSNSSTKTTLY
ncbi:C-C chemokine receptor type 1-like [Corythoichthys intestinalis]|uniref:C-C chemokine receptor type 1-like n=1 Tax=Corythoichthys intestinalis TaxID=161448 RepID=UPI0025A4EA54|nr:C-C chemokine receptor type 1-like [Corythoichthys intestinalis]XP_061810292.1 C-C chemokine receptor type 1-like [Nerophis lumbriciformis]